MFDRLRQEIQARIADDQKRSEALSRLEALARFWMVCPSPPRYTQLVGVLGDHITVLSFVLTPLFQSLMN